MTLDVAQRRARLAVRHHLAPSARAATVSEAVRSLVAVHSTDPASVYVGLRARVRDVTPTAIQAALYDERSVVRTLAMRRTLFVVSRQVLPVVHAAASMAVHRKERSRLVLALGDGGARRLRRLEDLAVAALGDLGEATAAELHKAVPALAEQVTLGAGTKWATEVAIGSRVLLLLALEGRVVRGRPRGSWISTQYRWAATDRWLGASLPEMPPEDARVELAREWLSSFGGVDPAPDLKWWTGWSVAETKRALAAVEVPERPPAAEVEPWVALLGPLDSTPMGWAERSWYLGDHKAALFDRNGNIGPTVWSDGRIVGGWAQRKDGEVVVRLLEDVGAEAAAAVDVEAAALEAWLQPVRFTSRFPTPLERSLRE